MKNHSFFILFFIFRFMTYGQQYDGLIIEKYKTDQNNIIYKPGSTFIFSYEILKNDTAYKIQYDSLNNYNLTPINKESVDVKHIRMIVTKPRLLGRTNKNQTQIFYPLKSSEYTTVSSTGLVENKDNIWLHPIRMYFFKCLETCPFPYVKLPLKTELEWQDSMYISNYWSDTIWGTWENNLLLKYSYKLQGDSSIQFKNTIVPCHIISSKSSSIKGTTQLNAFYNTQYGFMRLEYTLWKDIKINFQLVDIEIKPPLRSIKAYFKSL